MASLDDGDAGGYGHSRLGAMQRRLPSSGPCWRCWGAACFRAASMKSGDVRVMLLGHYPAPGGLPTVEVKNSLNACFLLPFFLLFS